MRFAPLAPIMTELMNFAEVLKVHFHAALHHLAGPLVSDICIALVMFRCFSIVLSMGNEICTTGTDYDRVNEFRRAAQSTFPCCPEALSGATCERYMHCPGDVSMFLHRPQYGQ